MDRSNGGEWTRRARQGAAHTARSRASGPDDAGDGRLRVSGGVSKAALGREGSGGRSNGEGFDRRRPKAAERPRQKDHGQRRRDRVRPQENPGISGAKRGRRYLSNVMLDLASNFL